MATAKRRRKIEQKGGGGGGCRNRRGGVRVVKQRKKVCRKQNEIISFKLRPCSKHQVVVSGQVMHELHNLPIK